MEFNSLIDVVFPVNIVIPFKFKVGMTPGTTTVWVLPMPVCVMNAFRHTKMVIVRCLTARIKILFVVGDENCQPILDCGEATTHQLDTANIFPEVVHSEVLCTLVFQHFNDIWHLLVEAFHLLAVPFGLVLQFHGQKLIVFAQENVQLQFIVPDIAGQLFLWNIVFHIHVVVMASADEVVRQMHLQVAFIEQ